MSKGAMLIISGPSGSGKSSLVSEMLEMVDNIHFSISTTTRATREGETDGINYHFVSKEEFERDIEEGLFLEWAKVHDNYYGTSLKHILKALSDGKLVVLDIDVQGHKIAREKFGRVITSIFLTTPNRDELKSRLIKRGADSKASIEKRINNAISEMTRVREYDYILINDDFKKTLKKLTAITISSKCKTDLIDTGEFMSLWAN